MKNLRNAQTGFSHIVLLVLVVLVAVIGGVGYKVMNKKAPSTTVSTVTIPSSFKTKADIVSATKSLDATDVDGSLDPSQLDTDLDNLL